MMRRAVGLVVLCVLAFSVLGTGQETGGGTPALQLTTRDPAPAAWEFYLGTWAAQDAFGATHTFTIYRQGQYGVNAGWEKSDLLLGTVTVADATELIFFDSDGGEDRYAIVAWTEPVWAYGVFVNELQQDADGNDRILLTVYRFVPQPQVESSRENILIVMELTRQPEEP